MFSLLLITAGTWVVVALCSLLVIGLVQATLREIWSRCFRILNEKFKGLKCDLSSARFNERANGNYAPPQTASSKTGYFN